MEALEIMLPRLDAYLGDCAAHDDPVALAMEARAARDGFPIVGPVVGRLLYQLTLLMGARRVFELGSGFGYSALWFARAMRDAGVDEGALVLTDGDGEKLASARRDLEAAGLWRHARAHQGDAVAALRADDGVYDVIFCDIDKAQYPTILEPALARLRPGGVLIVDNMLWKGRVLEAASGDDTEATVGVRTLTRRLLDDPRLITTLIPLRDGVSVSLRRADAAGAATA